MTGVDTATRTRVTGFGAFATIWAGQSISYWGSGLSTFALGVWVFQKTGSVTQFALIAVATALPTVVLLPFLGALVDRWDLRRTLIGSDALAAVATLGMWALFATGRIEVWHVYVAAALTSIASAVQWSAFSAATTLLVPQRQLSRAAGMDEFSFATANVAAPLLAALLIPVAGISGLLLADLATFGAAMATLLIVRIPARPEATGVRRPSVFHDVGFGWRYVTERPSLMRLLAFFSIANLFASFATVLVLPMVLGFSTTQSLGVVLSVGSIGLIVGGALMSAWGGPRRRVLGIVLPALLLGVSSAVTGLRPYVPLVVVGFFLFNLAIPIMQSCSQAIWQAKVPVAAQGRVFAIRRMIATFTRPVAFLLAGPIADGLFEPALEPDGALAGIAGSIVGTGPGRGIGFLLVLLGLALVATAIWGMTSPRLMRIEDDLPDANPEPRAS